MYWLQINAARIRSGFVENGRFEVKSNHVAGPGAHRDAAREVAEGCQGMPCVLLLDAPFALACDQTQLPKQTRPASAFRYALEEFLPLSAEQMEAGRIHGSNLGIAADSTLVSEWVQACREHGSEILHTGFTELEALQWLLIKDVVEPTGTVALHSECGVSVFKIADRKPVSWNWFPIESVEQNAVDWQIATTNLPPPRQFVSAGGRDSDPRGPASASWNPISVPMPVPEMAVRNAIAIANETRKPLLSSFGDSRRPSEIYSRELSRLGAAILLFVAGLCVSLWVRGNEYLQQAEDSATHTQQLYRKQFPEDPRTSLVNRTLASRLAELEHQESAQLIVGSTRIIRGSLHRFLLALPEDIEFEIDALNIRPDRIIVGGNVSKLDDLVILRSRLESAGFEIPDRDLRKDFQFNLIDKDLTGGNDP
jgi:hypothetical protein